MEKNKLVYYVGFVLIIFVLVLKSMRRLFSEQFKENILRQIMGLILPILGFALILAAYEEYDWMVNDYKYRFLKKIFTETGAKMFYYLFGLVLIAFGLWLVF